MPALSKGARINFNTLLRAARAGDLALLDCTDIATGLQVPTIVAVQRENDGSFTFVPLAKQFTGNPYDEISPPEET